MPQLYYSYNTVSTSLLDSLIKCDDTPHARSLFQSLKQKSSSSYAVMMNGCTTEENPFGAIDLFGQMKNDGVEANEIVYFNLIKALAQSGDYSTCQSIIEQMPNSFLHNNRIQTSLINMWVSRKKCSYSKPKYPLF